MAEIDPALADTAAFCERYGVSPDVSANCVVITGRREGAVAVIEVSDTGPGFSEKAREHLFEAFQGSTRTGGTGLGLAIAAELVRAHGGEILCWNNQSESGSTFVIRLPIATETSLTAAAKEAGR